MSSFWIRIDLVDQQLRVRGNVTPPQGIAILETVKAQWVSQMSAPPELSTVRDPEHEAPVSQMTSRAPGFAVRRIGDTE